MDHGRAPNGIGHLMILMTLLLRCVSAGIELPYHLGHAYIIPNTLQTGCRPTAVVVGST